MKKFLVISFSLSIVAIVYSTIIAQQKQIKFCGVPFAPFVITDQKDQKTSGFDIDLTHAMCKSVGRKCKFILQKNRTSLVVDLNSGKCDAWISGITISPDRKKHMDFTDSYYPSNANLIASQNSTFTASSKDLNNKKVAVTAGSNFIVYLETSYGFDINIVQFPLCRNSLAALKENKVDAVISDTPALQYWVQQKGNKDFRLIEIPEYNKVFSLGKGYGIPVKKDNIKLLTILNQALAKIKTDGTYDQIVKKYFANQ